MLLIGSSFCKCDVRFMKKIAFCVLLRRSRIEMLIADSELSLRGRGRGFPPATIKVAPAYFQRKVEEK